MTVSTEDAPTARRRVPVAAIVAGIVGVALIGGLVWLVVWAMGRDTGVNRPTFDDNRTPWESAMAKASVEATFPGGPVNLADVSSSGAQQFEATFTPEEIAALLAVYRYTAPQEGNSISFDSARLGIPQAGWVTITGRIVVNNTAYSARASGPVTWDGSLEVDESATRLTVEGFGVDGARKAQAVRAIEDYLTGFIRAAPGLIVREATVSTEGFEVTGTAPAVLEHPEPAGP